MILKVLPSIWIWGQHGVLCKTEDGMIMIDPPNMSSFEELEEIGAPDYIYLTSPAHEREAELYETQYHAVIMGHDEETFRAQMTGTFLDKDILPGGFRVIHLKKGESAFLFKSVLITGGILMSVKGKIQWGQMQSNIVDYIKNADYSFIVSTSERGGIFKRDEDFERSLTGIQVQ